MVALAAILLLLGLEELLFLSFLRHLGYHWAGFLYKLNYWLPPAIFGIRKCLGYSTSTTHTL